MDYLPKYMIPVEQENAYYCEICLAILSTRSSIDNHWLDIYHNERLLQIRRLVYNYEQQMFSSLKDVIFAQHPIEVKKFNQGNETLGKPQELKLRKKIEKLKKRVLSSRIPQ